MWHVYRLKYIYTHNIELILYFANIKYYYIVNFTTQI